jgi:hypothetical protein
VLFEPGGFEIDFRLEDGVGHLPHLGEDGHRCCRHTLEGLTLHHLVNQSLAPLHDLVYDAVVVHEVAPSEEVRGNLFNRIRHGPSTYNLRAHPFHFGHSKDYCPHETQ